MSRLFRNYFLFSVVLTTSWLLASSCLASEQIDSFNAKIEINQDASLSVQETILYNFGTDAKHGIFRDIPIEYPLGTSTRVLKISGVTILDQAGTVYSFTESQIGNYYRIKIGDPNRTVTGQKTFNITYRVEGALNYFLDHDELYWNVTGNGWPVAIKSATAIISINGLTSEKSLQFACFRGLVGEKNSCQSQVMSLETTNPYDNKLPVVFLAEDLAKEQGMTAVLGFPKGLVAQVLPFIKAGNNFAGRPVNATFDELMGEPLSLKSKNILLTGSFLTFGILGIVLFLLNFILPIIVFIWMVRLWRLYGKDPDNHNAVVPQYAPPDGVAPGMVGIIMNQATNQKDVTGEIINFAVNGYLRIEQVMEKQFFGKKIDYKMIKVKDWTDLPFQHQRDLMSALFSMESEVIFSAVQSRFSTQVQNFNQQVSKQAAESGLYSANPSQVIMKYAKYTIPFIILAFLGVMIGSVISIIIIVVFAYIMPAKTQKGVAIKDHLLGLKMYLTVAEKDRLEFHNAPEKNPQLFEKLLPYAIALDVVDLWVKQFAEIPMNNPTWYNGHMANFSAVAFASELNSFSNALQPPSSHGAGGSSGFSGGSSGGGMGGGGGGSW